MSEAAVLTVGGRVWGSHLVPPCIWRHVFVSKLGVQLIIMLDV